MNNNKELHEKLQKEKFIISGPCVIESEDMVMYLAEHIKKITDELGLIYIFKPSVLKNYKNRFGGKVGIYKTKFWQSVEIDDKEDWGLVKTIFKHYLEKYYREFIV